MSYFTDMPGTNSYDGDLGWLIREYKRLLSEYENLLKIVNELQKQYEEIPSVIKNAIDDAMAIQIERINGFIASVESDIANVNNRMDNMENELNSMSDSIRNMKLAINEMKIFVAGIEGRLQMWVKGQNELIINKVKDLLANFIKEFPKVNCPVDKKQENINTALMHVYNANSLGVPVWLFDSLKLTEAELEKQFPLTVLQFDRYGLLYFWTYQWLYFTSPVTGKKEDVKTIVYELASLHKKGVNVERFDGDNITVADFDNAKITVYNHDWTSNWILQFE